MEKKIVEGLWDCPFCDTKKIGGLTKHCPSCGHPQDENTEFYMGEKIEYLEDEIATQYGQGADWHCPYCGSLNRVHFKFCCNCGAPKDESEKDYFDLHPDNAEQNQKEQAPKQTKQKQTKESKKPKKKKRKFILAAILFTLFAIFYSFWPRDFEGTVTAASWGRQIDIEAYRTVQESDWSVPDGGRVYDEKTEISHYEQVIDHYETRTRQVSEEVYDGEDYHTSYKNNGDGTFTESSYSTPRYRTVYRTETYQEPIYRDEPVYATKYYYEIEKWVVDRTEESMGVDSDPYWPEYTLADNERTGLQIEVYLLYIDTEEESYSVSVPYEMWKKYHTNDQVEISVIQDEVIMINGEDVEEE